MLKYLKTCFTFLRVKHDKLTYIQWYIPLFMSFIMTTLFLWCLPIEPKIFGENSLVIGINSLLGIVIGFYIASIAAIASFNKHTLDDTMDGTPPMLQNNKNGENESEPLTRRRFFCIIFGYCAVISIFIYMLGLFTNMLLPSFYDLISTPWIIKSIKCVWLFIYFFFVISLGCTTILGLHYLIERIHR